MRTPAIVLLVIAAACGGSDSPPTNPSGNKSVDVFTLPSAFSPNILTINAGDTAFVLTAGKRVVRVRLAELHSREATIEWLRL